MTHATKQLTFKFCPLHREPPQRRTVDKSLRKRIRRIVKSQEPLGPQRRVLQLLGQHHAPAIIDPQLLLQKGLDALVEPGRRQDPIHQAPLLQLLRGEFPAKHEKVVGAVNPHALRKVAYRPVLGDEAERREGDLQEGRFHGEDDVCQPEKPGRSAADGRAVQGDDEHFLVLYYRAD